MIESIKHLFHTLYDVRGLITNGGGILLVCGIVFVETGLFVGFFLPGDSLLVTAGIVAAAGLLNIWTLVPLAILCAIVGDQVGYAIGRQAGQALYSRPDSMFFKRRHLERAHQFYEAHGGVTIILARFMPIVRTFCPPVAGAARMSYTKYLSYDIIGGTLWVGSMTLGGYAVGKLMPNLGDRIHYVILAVVFLSLLPAIIGALRARGNKSAAPIASNAPESNL
jgi:membrane-associated protein